MYSFRRTRRLITEFVLRRVWDTGENVTSAGQVLFAVLELSCEVEPVGPVLDP